MKIFVLRSLVPLMFCLGAVAEARNAPAHDILPLKPVEKTLPNGLKVIAVRSGFPNIVSVQIPVQTGSRNEFEPGKTGFAHFFEHMMFRGTPAYPPDKYQAILTRSGARSNAYTTDDFTNYHTTFAKQDLETILKMEADRFQHLSYSPEVFKTEARAVLGEYNKNSANPFQKLFEVVRDTAYTSHTYKHTTMGFIQDIENMPNQFDYSKTFFDRWYRPEYTTVIVVGDINPPETIKLVEKYWASWKRGDYRAIIAQEPPPSGPKYAHVPWKMGETLPIVTISFHGPAFSEKSKELPALDALVDLYVGPTSDLYRRLVQKEQKVDSLGAHAPLNADPSLLTISSRVKKAEDVAYVRDAILATLAETRLKPVSSQKLAEAKSHNRYALARTLDNTETIAGTLARFVRLRRSFDTFNQYYRLYDGLTVEDLSNAAKSYLSDSRMVVVTLSKDPLPAEVSQVPRLASFQAKTSLAAPISVMVQKTAIPQLNIKLNFAVGSSGDPKGKEGLAQLAASMIVAAGSAEMSIDEIRRALFPIAGSFNGLVDKDMTTFTATMHRDNWKKFFDAALPMLLTPGFREEDFRRLKDNQLNALKQDLRNNNEEELGKERLQANIFRGSPYGHPVVGTISGIESIGLADVKAFVRSRYTRRNLAVRLLGDAPEELVEHLKRALSGLEEGALLDRIPVTARVPNGIEVEIVQKQTRATALSLGHPIEVTRSHPDFPALWLARAWLGEHRSSQAHLFNRIREARGLNYGDYAYIEAFPRAGYAFFPPANVARQKQIFEIWIRPVVPANAHAALRIAIYELQKLIDQGLTREQLEATREYLMKNVYLMIASQDQQNGYALDSKFYGISDFAEYMRDKLGKLTLDDVNRAIKKHLSSRNLSVVIVAQDAAGLRDKLVSDAPSALTYDAPKPAEIVEEDKLIGSLKLDLKAANVKITPVEEVFARDAAGEVSASTRN